ncbi:hypothetical protein Pelo_16919 [Pelomyxa schiedti]|nr:hypothetical protein Pelo_16919 [Pelomyxa schiedti]
MGNCTSKVKRGPHFPGGRSLTVIPDTKPSTTTVVDPRCSDTALVDCDSLLELNRLPERPRLNVGSYPRVKICLLGDYGAGKTTFCCKSAGVTLPLVSPMGEFIVYFDNLNGDIILTNTSSSHWRGASFGLLFFDVQEPGSNLTMWINTFKMFSPPQSEIIIVGNKNDLIQNILPDSQSKLLNSGMYKTFYISVKTGAGVDKLWEYIHQQIVTQYNSTSH